LRFSSPTGGNATLGIGWAESEEWMAAARIILSVIGPHSGCGKTSFVTHLLRHISGLGCLKISPAHDWPDGVARRAEAIGEDFYLEDLLRLKRPGKDTALYMTAGATEVKRLRHRGDGLAAGLDAAIGCYSTATRILVESSSAVPLLSPAAVVLVVRPPPREMKPSTEAILSRVTDLLINTADGDGVAATEAARLCHQFPALHPQFTWSADLISEPPPAGMLTRLQALLAS